MSTILGKVIEAKMMTWEQVEAMRKRSIKEKQPIQDLFIDTGIIDEEEFFRIGLTAFFGPVIDREEEIVDASCVELIPYAMARYYGVFPVRRESRGLLLAMSNPHDLAALEDVRFVTELPLKPALCTKSQIASFIKEYYVKGRSARDLLAKAQIENACASDPDGVPGGEENKDIAELYDERSDLLQFINRLIADAIDDRASDIHIEPQEHAVCVRYRIDGHLKDVIDIPKQLLDRVISRIKILAKLDIAEKRKFQDGRISVWMEGRKIDLRISVIPAYYGEKAVVRILDSEKAVFGFNEIGLGPKEKAVFVKAITRNQGVVLLTGPTGSGKTTTIYSALQHIKAGTRNIVTIEDPVEYLIKGANQVQLNRIKDVTFANCLRSILRQDPDVLFVGEIRDKETAEVAFQASLTGHLVFSSLHTNSAASSIIRLMDIGLEPYLIASSVHLIVSQRLVRMVCPKCKVVYSPSKWLKDKFKMYLEEMFIDEYVKGKGCRDCGFTGYQGRTSLFEMLRVNQKIKTLIANKASESVIFKQALKNGMKTLAESGLEKVAAGLTTLEEVAAVADVVEVEEDISIFDLIQEKYLTAGNIPGIAAI
jgi:type IV pilus assembly protein PilB